MRIGKNLLARSLAVVGGFIKEPKAAAPATVDMKRHKHGKEIERHLRQQAAIKRKREKQLRKEQRDV